MTLPTDVAFTPDIQCSTYGQKLYVAAQKLSAYTTLGTAVATTDISSAIQLSKNTSWVRTGSGEEVDYTNPKCIKAETGITFESGRLRMYSKCDGGEGLESKANLKINGGIVLAVGSASNMQYGSSGTQKSCLATSASLATCSGKYLKIADTSCYVKIPTASSSSGTCSLMCSAPGCTAVSSLSVYSTPPTSGTDIVDETGAGQGFQDVVVCG